MKVLIVTFEFLPFSGGIAVYTGAVANGLAKLGCDVTVLAPHYSGCEAIDGQLRYETVRMRVGHGDREVARFGPGMRQLSRQLARAQPDVVMLTSDLAHGIGGICCAHQGVPYVVVLHGSEIVKHFPPRTMKRYAQQLCLKFSYSRARSIFCVSRYVAGLVRNAGFSEHKLKLIYNGIDERFLHEAQGQGNSADIRNRHHLDNNIVLFTLARLVPRKGQAQVIRILPSILKHHANTRYLIAGVGPDRQRLECLAGDVGVLDSVVFAGEIDAEEKIDYLDSCDVYIQLSRSDGERVEGLGLSLLEAAARGRPLIGTPHGGIPEIVEDEVSGLIIDPMRIERSVERVVDLIKDQERRIRMGEAAKQKVAAEFSAAMMAQRTKQYLEAVL